MKRRALLALSLLLQPGFADEMTPPSAIEPNSAATFVYYIDRPLRSAADLMVEWTDNASLVVARASIAVDSTAGGAIPFDVDLRQAFVMDNTLHAWLVQDGNGRPAITMHFMAPPHGDP